MCSVPAQPLQRFSVENAVYALNAQRAMGLREGIKKGFQTDTREVYCRWKAGEGDSQTNMLTGIGDRVT